MLRDRPAFLSRVRLGTRVSGGAWAAVLAGLVLALSAATAIARSDADRTVDIAPIGALELPPEGRTVLAAIRAGGPFDHRRDGAPFGNRERLLPLRERGYYAEYTVPTPGATNRGARRIVAGRGATRDVRTSGEYYYTQDHYRSFRRIVQ